MEEGGGGKRGMEEGGGGKGRGLRGAPKSGRLLADHRPRKDGEARVERGNDPGTGPGRRRLLPAKKGQLHKEPPRPHAWGRRSAEPRARALPPSRRARARA